MDFDPLPCFNSILEKVKPHIPTIDFDSSEPEIAGVIAIYERPAGRSLQLPEDPDSFSTEDAVLEANSCQSNIIGVSAKPDMDNTQSYKDMTVLSFARLDQYDLDNDLQNLKNVTTEPAKTQEIAKQFLITDSNKDRSQADIMERLDAFCKSQSSKSLSEPVKNPNHIRRSNVWNETLENMVAEQKQSHRGCSTVFNNSQCPDPSVKLPGTSPNILSESKPSVECNLHQEVPPAKQHILGVHNGSQVNRRDLTGKSMLLQKIRMNKNIYPNVYTEHPDSVPGNKVEEQKSSQPVVFTSSQTSQHLRKHKQSSAVRQQSGQQIQQPEQTLQSKEYLQIHRPTKSASQKDTAAERTDVLYDFEGSHLQSFSMLPEDIKSKGCILLTVCLFSPGMVDRAHGKRKRLYPAAAQSHTYNTLVAWFLSLVGPEPRHDEENVSQVPFWVAGLQQMWTEDGLALHVLAVAHQCSTPMKRDIGISTSFYSCVCRFLSETSLTQIAHWLPNLQILLDQRAFASPIHLPSSSLNSFISATLNKEAIEGTFGLSPGFYWQTVETQGCVCKRREATHEPHIEVSFALGCSGFFLYPLITHYALKLILDSGLDVCGLRLLYPPQRFLTDSAGVTQSDDEARQPAFALAVRGPHAFSLLKDIEGSLSPLLPKKTDPISDSQGQKPAFFCSPRLASQVHTGLCLWFSGRLQGRTAQNHNQQLKRVASSTHGVRGGLFHLSRSSAFLCATTKADVLLVVSPAVPPCCYGQVLAVCECRGFILKGLQRLQLQSKGVALLRLTNQQAKVFCTSPFVMKNPEELECPSQCLVLLLEKENAIHHSLCLPAAILREFKAQKLLSRIQSRRDGVQAVEPSLYFHTVPYSNKLFDTFVKFMWTAPDPSSVILSHWNYQSNCDMEHVVILTLCGYDMSNGLSLLHQMLSERPEGGVEHVGFKLLGLKWLPVLTQLQAQELSPYEVGEQPFHSSVNTLMSSPALLCVLRRRDALACLKKLLPCDYPGDLSVLMSSTPEVTFRQASLFFKHEIIYGKIVECCM